MPAGRPKKKLTSLARGWKKRLLQLGEQGHGREVMIAELKISQGLWDRWLEEEPDFQEVIETAMIQCKAWWYRQNVEGLYGDRDGPRINAQVLGLNMRNRFKWDAKDQFEDPKAKEGDDDIDYGIAVPQSEIDRLQAIDGQEGEDTGKAED